MAIYKLKVLYNTALRRGFSDDGQYFKVDVEASYYELEHNSIVFYDKVNYVRTPVAVYPANNTIIESIE